MRPYFLSLVLLLSACATLSPDIKKTEDAAIVGKTLAPGDCGLYVWTADAIKTFTLFASSTEISYFKGQEEIMLTEDNPANPPSTIRSFTDTEGKTLSLTLLSPEDIEGGIRYKAGRLTSLSSDGWEKVVPIVGFYACQPLL
ncbi:hypothetical protein [Hellea balneolensis]|uniref:hypothetical protein n=1 Tax=Hellea balneolensis TaxID=287478 RepID=UPI0004154E46|nr:hypothetical protein [Hellea balneolensis]